MNITYFILLIVLLHLLAYMFLTKHTILKKLMYNICYCDKTFFLIIHLNNPPLLYNDANLTQQIFYDNLYKICSFVLAQI